METPKEVCERLEGDVDKILGMYDLASKVYPYKNAHPDLGAAELNENIKR